MSFASTLESAVDKYFNKNQKYFKSKKGENFELKNDLNSEYKSIRKDAVKRVIANMTLGKNVSELFADVLKCMQTDDLELKKLVYLYLMNYAKTQPELVILAVNTFVKDAEDLNPLIRALAIRTMGCLRAEKIVDYLFEPLKKGLQDQDPYVRKTAAICVAKMFTLAPDRTVEYGFVEQVEKLLIDDNPMVIANAIAALHEMRSFKSSTVVNLNINSQSLNKLLGALNECTEWGQIVILESLCEYHTITDPEEAMLIADKVSARLQHQNPSVVLTAIRLIMICLLITPQEFTDTILKKSKGPIISLLNQTQSELLFSFLRNMHIIVEQYPNLLNGDLRPFFCKYNDPLYVKLEKLSLLVKLANQESIDALLSELKEYASEVDIEFVTAAIHAFQVIALKFPNTNEKCVNCLLELLKTKVDYICSDAAKALSNIIRKYPGQFDKSVEFIAPLLLLVDGLPGKEAIIYLIGEFPGHVVGIYDVLECLINGFSQESVSNQLAILIMTVKCFLKRPNDAKIQAHLQSILQLGTECLNADIRDRAYIYWRMLSIDPELTKKIVWTKKEGINDNLESWPRDAQFISKLLRELGTTSALFHVDSKLLLKDNSAIGGTDNTQLEQGDIAGDLLDLGEDVGALDVNAAPPTNALDLLESFGPGPVAQQILSPNGSPVHIGQQVSGSASAPTGQYAPLMDSPELTITYKYSKQQDGVYLSLQLRNNTTDQLGGFAIQFNKNSYGLVPAALMQVTLSSKQATVVELPLTNHMESMYQQTVPFNGVQIAIKHDKGIGFGNSVVPININTFEPMNKEMIYGEMKGVERVGFETKSQMGLEEIKGILGLGGFVKDGKVK